MKLIIVRHGKTDWNKTHRMQGHTNIDLNANGRNQIKKLALRLKNCHFDRIYSSPLKRALSTAKEIKRYHENAKLIIEKDIIEINLGILEGLTKKEFRKKYPDIWKKREKDKLHYRILNGESHNDVKKRALRALKKVIKSKKDTIIVSHYMPIKFLLQKLTKKAIHKIKIAGISIFDIKGNKMTYSQNKSD